MSDERAKPKQGHCLCDGVAYTVSGPLREVVYCHCGQCRRSSGHFVAATGCAPSDLTFQNDETLSWYPSSEHAERGFCNRCGGNLFWRPAHGEHISIMAGTLTMPTGVKAVRHLYAAEAADYHEICDGLEQVPYE